MHDALRAMRHRGPDDQGYQGFELESGGRLYLGHTRLSIIDLSSGGHQPMDSIDGRYSMVFNGEIYNYRELKHELAATGHVFRSDSDTEVLLVAWRHWGRDCLARLVGMFAFAVFDRLRQTITCVRDAFGIKPFFYSSTQNSFVFASEVTALNCIREGKPELDFQQAYDYLVLADYDSSERTFFRDVRHLRPGYLLTVQLGNGATSLEQWWKPEISQRSSLSFADAAQHLRKLFLDNVRLHLRSDVPLGAALSGGLDSSAVVCAMRCLEPEATINTFSYIAAGSDVSEEKWVDDVSSYVGSRAYKVRVTSEELVRDLDDMIAVQGEPFGSTSIYAQYRVFKLARENGVTVTLDGQGADELLGGYNGYPGPRLHSLVDRRDYLDVLRFLNSWSKWPGRTWRAGATRLVGELTDGPLHDVLRNLVGQRNSPDWINSQVLREAGVKLGWPSRADSSDAGGRRMMSALRDALTVKGLPALLRHADRNSMRFSVESRVPFLTIEMAEFLLSLPEQHLVADNGETKSIFRAAMRGVVPDRILDRRDKIGFATPEREWIVEMSNTIRGWLSSDIGLPFLDQKALLKEFDQVVDGRRPFGWQVWRWINFYRWYQLRIYS
jgi:asparagine synthase (glutamine-hydrolysing)